MRREIILSGAGGQGLIVAGAILADSIASMSVAWWHVLFILLSCLSSLAAGKLLFRSRISAAKLVLLGLTNYTTIIGFALISWCFVLKPSKEHAQSAPFLAFIALFVVFFGLSTCLLEWGLLALI